MTSLILDLFFIAMVFRLPVMKSMTLTELCDRYYEMEDLAILMEREEYKYGRISITRLLSLLRHLSSVKTKGVPAQILKSKT